MSDSMTFGVVFGGIFGLVGFILTALAVFFLLRTRSFMETAEQTQGTVINMLYSRSSDGGGGYSAVYRFRTITGQEVEVRDNLSSNPPQFKVGQTIDVLYDPENPQSARIKKWFNLYFLPALLGFLGIIFGCIGIGAAIAAWFGYFE